MLRLTLLCSLFQDPSFLVTIGIQHDSEGLSHGLGWQVSEESSSDKTSLSVGFADGSPDGSEFGVSL